MSKPHKDDLFLGWNLIPSDEHDVIRPTRNRVSPDQGGGTRDGVENSWDETRSIARPESFSRKVGDLAANFVIDQEPGGVGPAAWFQAPRRSRSGAATTTRSRSPSAVKGSAASGLVSELGRGAFGRVYLAEESGLGNRPVALKVTRARGGTSPGSWPGSSTPISCRSTRSPTTRNPGSG